MKLASLKSGARDGTLVIVDRELKTALPASESGFATLQSALENWADAAPALETTYRALNQRELDGLSLRPTELASPLPRAYQWLDGSAYLSHVERVRKARGAPMPPSLYTDPLMYQGGSAAFLGSRDPIRLADESWGLDFEAEVAAITDDVPMGTTPEEAASHIKLLMLVNDVSLRNLIPQELAKGFGFLHGKPGPAFSPIAVTPDELEDAWDGGKIHLPLLTYRSGILVGNPDAGQGMQFGFPALIAHAAKTRPLPAGTIVGSGTVSNADTGRGYSCIAEKRVLEQIESGEARTPYLRHGETVRIEMIDRDGRSVFGAIEQDVRPWQP
ncbi:fumarylacetoacetate hydrolase family protein [Methylocaldum sp.]|uniref:fumarylacetoacetate hydrolase family protein n=1 Tax=Methylocaldum sp. TaxID=1969727 RepID=UPI002D700F1F|nr:fumarylacetoacetate hydrolase family protein [Methylocaldum sp.]HYE37398.1 fumarylacetoacetate hydrolase family protein [Methylocaldum sp.]